MADYEANPSVTTPGTIRLYGNEYPLLEETNPDGSTRPGAVQVVLSTTPPPKVKIGGDYGKDDQPTISTYSVHDLTGGMGLWEYQNEADLNRFYYSEGMNTLYVRQTTLGPLLTEVSKPAAADAVAPVFGQLTDVLMVSYPGGGSAKYYSFDGTSFSALLDTDNLAARPTVYNNRIFWPRRFGAGSGYGYQTSTSSVVTNVATPEIMSFTVWDGKLYGLDTSFVLYSSTSGDAASWTTLATISDVGEAAVTGYSTLMSFDDADGSTTVWALTPRGPWSYDAAANKWFRQKFQFHKKVSASFIASSLGTTWRGKLYEVCGTREIYELDMNGGQLTVRDVSLDRPSGFPNNPTIWSMASTNDLLFVGAFTSVSGTDRTGIFAYNGKGWHQIQTSTGTTGDPNFSIMPFDDGTNYRLYTGSAATDGSLAHFNLDNLALAPNLGTQTFAASGMVILPIFNGGYASQRKTAIQCRLKLLGASAGVTVQIAYRLNGSIGSFTDLGSAVSATTEQTIKFGTSSVGTAFKSIQFRLTFVTNSSSSAPKMEYFAMDYIVVAETLRGFIITLDCRKAWGQRTSRQLIDNLWTAIDTDTLGTFAWRDDSTVGSSNTRSYLVKVMRPEGLEMTGRDEAGVYKLMLISYGAN